MHRAAYCGHNDIIKVLIANGADIQLQDDDGVTPLHKAAEQGQLLAVKLLLEFGASKMVTNSKGKTPLECAKTVDITQLLK